MFSTENITHQHDMITVDSDSLSKEQAAQILKMLPRESSFHVEVCTVCGEPQVISNGKVIPMRDKLLRSGVPK